MDPLNISLFHKKINAWKPQLYNGLKMMQTWNQKTYRWSHHWVFLGQLSRSCLLSLLTLFLSCRKSIKMPLSQNDPCRKFCLNPSSAFSKHFLSRIGTHIVFTSAARVQEVWPDWWSSEAHYTQSSAQWPGRGSWYPTSLHPGRRPIPTDHILKCLCTDKAFQGPW